MDDATCAWTNQADTVRTWFGLKYLSAVDSACSLLRTGQCLWVLTPVDAPQTQVVTWFKMLLKLLRNKGAGCANCLASWTQCCMFCRTGLMELVLTETGDRDFECHVGSYWRNLWRAEWERKARWSSCIVTNPPSRMFSVLYFSVMLVDWWIFTVPSYAGGLLFGDSCRLSWMNEWVSLSMGTLLRNMEGAPLPGTLRERKKQIYQERRKNSL